MSDAALGEELLIATQGLPLLVVAADVQVCALALPAVNKPVQRANKTKSKCFLKINMSLFLKKV
jgi:hypothetical protein